MSSKPVKHFLQFKDLSRDEPHHVLDGIGLIVKGRHCRKHDNAKPREFQHVFEVYGVKRGFARNQNKPPPFFHDAVRGPLYEVTGRARGESREGSHGARADYHGLRHGRAARQGRPYLG